MRIFKGQKIKPKDKIRNFYIMRYLGIGLVLLCFPFVPLSAPGLPSVFQSRYWLLADILLLWSVGGIFEKSLFQAIIQDAKEKKEGGDALNASSLLFFAVPLLFLFNCAAVVHLYAMWYLGPSHTLPGVSERLQCAALATGFVLCIYGRFLPAAPYKSKWGICTKASLVSLEGWKSCHKAAGKRMMTGGFVIIIPSIFLSGTAALAAAAILAVGILGSCYLIKPSL